MRMAAGMIDPRRRVIQWRDLRWGRPGRRRRRPGILRQFLPVAAGFLRVQPMRWVRGERGECRIRKQMQVVHEVRPGVEARRNVRRRARYGQGEG